MLEKRFIIRTQKMQGVLE